jgi:nucleoside-diphosphate-sugar epimerase
MDIITRILVTGTEGYLGSLLAPELMRQGYEVIGLDTGFYKERAFYRDGGTTPLTLAKDLRHVGVEDLKNVDAVVHMAELSNDPAGQLADHYVRNQPQGFGSSCRTCPQGGRKALRLYVLLQRVWRL